MTLLREPPSDEVVHTNGSAGERIRPRSWDTNDVIELLGAALSSFCLTWLVYEKMTSLTGGLGFFVCWFAAFLVIYWLLVRQRHGRFAAKDRVMATILAGSGLLVLVTLGIIVGYTFFRGFGTFRPRFFTQDMRFTSPLAPATAGGGEAAIIGSVEQIAIALVLSVPAGIAVAVLLSEIRGRLGRLIRIFVEAMNGIPSVLAGLFIFAVWILQYKHAQSGFAVALALSVSMLPTVARTAMVVLNLVPGGLREASLALGGTEWRMVRKVVLPTARAGLITAIILGMARVVGETAPAVIDDAPNNSINWNPFKGPQDNLPAFVYRFIRTPVHNDIHRAWTGAMVLIFLVLVLFVLARLFSGSAGSRSARRVAGWFRRPAATVAPSKGTS